MKRYYVGAILISLFITLPITQNVFPMFSHSVFSVLVSLPLPTNPCMAAEPDKMQKVHDSTKAVQAFQNKVSKFKAFFSKMPKALNEQSFSKSPTGSAFIFLRIKNADIAYDIRKTNSLISPLVGYIYLTYDTVDNSECGDLSVTREELKDIGLETAYYGFSTAAKAKNNDNEECYRHSGAAEKTRFTFAYQENRWVFKDVIREDYNEPAIIISTAVGKPVGPAKYRHSAVQINRKV